MNKECHQAFFESKDWLIIKQIKRGYQEKNLSLQVINFFIFTIKIRILKTYIDVFNYQGGTSSKKIYHYLVILYRLFNTRLDAVIRKYSQSLQREPRNIERDKGYPSSATQDRPSHLFIHRFNLNVELEVLL